MNQKTTLAHLRVSRRGLIGILALFTLLGLLYDFFVPIFEKPDELKHFAVVQYIQTRHQLPVVRAGIYRPWDQEGTQPPLYHILVAAATSWLDLSQFAEPARNPHYADDRSFVWRQRGNNNLYLHPPGEAWHLTDILLAAQIARLISLLAGVTTVFLTYRLAQIIWGDETAPNFRKSGQAWDNREKAAALFGESNSQRFTIYRWLPLLAAALVAFVPQFLHVSSAITNDSLTVTLAAAALLLMTIIVKDGTSTKNSMLLGLVLGLGAVAKLSLLYLYPLVGLLLVLDFYRRRSFAQLVKAGLTIGLVSLCLAGWWYWRNWQIYGDISALNAHLLYRGGALDPRPTLAQLWQTELTGLEITFWAAFGAGQVLIDPWIYTALRWLKYLILVGVGLGLWQIILQIKAATGSAKNRPATDRNQDFGGPVTESIMLGFLALWAIIIFVALLRWMQITPASWGRLLYPALPALAVLSAWGLIQFPRLAQKLTKTVLPPNRATRFFRFTLSAIPGLVVLALFTLSLLSPFYYIRAAYAKTPLITEANIPANVTRLDFLYGNEALRLVGYRIEQPSVQPGQWLPVTLYWQATRPIEKNYSTFIHLLDPAGHSIAQVNTYPDGGRWPTSLLPPGPVLKDTYHIFVPPDVSAPIATRLAIGIFEFDDPLRAAKTAQNDAGDVIEPIVPGVPVLPQQWPELAPTVSLRANFANQIQLIGYDWVDQTVQPGQSAALTLYWKTVSAPGKDLNLFIHLVDPVSHAQVTGFDGPPSFPTGYWQPGTAIIDERTLTFPDSLSPGQYDLYIGWYNLEDFARLPLEQEKPADALRVLSVTVQ